MVENEFAWCVRPSRLLSNPVKIMTRLLVFIQFYDHRKKHLKNEERERWMQIDYRDMTEESDIDEDKVGQQKLPWRSNSNVIKLNACY